MHDLSQFSSKPRRYNAVVCAIARDEDRYLLEWAAYHLAIGFDHIYLYDNMSRRRIARLFGERARGRVTVIRWPTLAGRDAQLEAYEHFLWAHGGDCEWAAVIDLDEMINLKRHATVGAFLRGFEGATAVALNWRIFGSSGRARAERGLVMSRFPRASEIDFWDNQHVKTIYRTRYLRTIGHHNGSYFVEPAIVSPSGRRLENAAAVGTGEADFAVAQVNHYFVKSREEWEAKLRRGYADGTVRPPGTFEKFDRNEVEETSILRHRAATRRIAARIAPSFARAGLAGAGALLARRLRALRDRRPARPAEPR